MTIFKNIKINSKSKSCSKSISFILSTLLLVSLVLSPIVSFAAVMQSSSYKIGSDSLNFGGGKSTSATYNVEDTAGEVGTGRQTDGNLIFQAGYQQADVVSASAGTSGTGGTGSAGNVGRPSGYGVINVSEFTADALTNSILLKWVYPKVADIVSVKIVRSDKFYPVDMSDGEVVFEGTSDSVIDYDVKPGVTYYYALFAKNSLGIYSSGTLANATILKAGEIPGEKSYDPFAGIKYVTKVSKIIESLTLSDFVFIQDETAIIHSNDTVPVDGKRNLTIRLPYGKVPELLKTIAISLTDPDDSAKVFSFLLRVNKDKTFFEATIAPLQKSGDYKLNVIVLDYKNQGLKRLSGNLKAVVFESVDILSSFKMSGPLKMIFGILLLIVVAFIISIILYKRKKDENK